MAWLDWAVHDPAPEAHAGYWNGQSWTITPQVDPSLKHGAVIHSPAGYFTYVSPSGVMRGRGNSWDVTIFRDGRVWKHRPTPNWVNWHGGSPAANLTLIGVEMEGVAEPWTDAQRGSLQRVLVETWQWFGWREARWGSMLPVRPPTATASITAAGKGSLWDHRWLSATACPNGRNDGERGIAGIIETALSAEEDDMTPEQDARLKNIEGMLTQLLSRIAPAPAPPPTPPSVPAPPPAPTPTSELPYQTWQRIMRRPWPRTTELATIYRQLSIADGVGSASGNIKVQQALLRGWRP